MLVKWHSVIIAGTKSQHTRIVNGRNLTPLYWRGIMSSFAIYLIGFIIFVGALSYGAFLLGVPTTWIAVGALVLLGLGIFMGVGKTRQKDDTEA